MFCHARVMVIGVGSDLKCILKYSRGICANYENILCILVVKCNWVSTVYLYAAGLQIRVRIGKLFISFLIQIMLWVLKTTASVRRLF